MAAARLAVSALSHEGRLISGLVVENLGKDSSLVLKRDLPLPPISEPDDVLIEVRAVGVNRADLLQRQGRYPAPAWANSTLLGLEVSGIVRENINSSSLEQRGLRVGDRVMALLPSGGYASHCVVPWQCVLPLPSEATTFVHAAAMMESYITAFQALFWHGGLEDDDASSSGKTVLFHAGASALGLAGIQLCKLSSPANRIVVTVGSDDKKAACLAAGADVAVNYKTEQFDQVVAEYTSGRGADIVVDCVGAPYWHSNVASLATDGKLILLGFLGGSRPEGVDLLPLCRKRCSVIGSVLRDRSIDYKRRLIAAFHDRFGAALKSGALRPVIDSVYPIHDVEKAHDRVRDNLNIGKVVLEVVGDEFASSASS